MGLANDLVVAPYAAALAVSIAPKRVVRNFEHLTKEGGLGAYGFYESLDYSRDRLPPKVRRAVVKCFMAHHQGMALLALGNYLLDDPIPRRFHAEPMVQATELLLQERVPQAVPLLELHDDEISLPQPESSEEHLLSRRLTTPHTSHPRTHLLGNSSYRVMVTNVGSGQSSQGDLAIPRWREDVTRDDWGQFLYLRDLASDEVWSAGYQPVRREADEYEVIYSADKAEIRRVDGDVETHLEITVSPESPAEIRRVKLTNHGSAPRSIELTSYLELALAPQAADLAHPAFSKLFLETEYIEAENCAALPPPPSLGRSKADLGRSRVGPRRASFPAGGIRDRPRAILGSRSDAGRSGRNGCRACGYRGRSAPCSIRSSAFAAGLNLHRNPPRKSPSRPPWPTAARKL